METQTFRIHKRIIESLSQIQSKSLKPHDYIFYGGGWWFSFYFLLSSFELNFLWPLLWASLTFYFFNKLKTILLDQFRIPEEIYLVIIFLFMAMDYPLWSSFGPDGYPPFYYFKSILHFSLLSVICLAAALFITSLSKGKITGVILYLFFIMAGHFYIFEKHGMLLFIFQALLFFSLLKRTGWLEKLTRTEHLIYFFIFLLIFINLIGVDASYLINRISGKIQVGWFSLPFFLFCFIRLFLLAFLIKIPLVFIYNHASLSRKLKIAGLFQSSFPQFIQLLAIVYIFYLFLAGWQADQLRQVLIKHFYDQGPSTSNTEYHIPQVNSFTTQTIKVPGYRPFHFDFSYPEQGIVRLHQESSIRGDNTHHYFYYHFTAINQVSNLSLKLIDDGFINNVGRSVNPMIGDKIAAFLYDHSFLQDFSDKVRLYDTERNIQVRPFHLMEPVYNGENRIAEENISQKNIRNNKLDLKIGPITLQNSGIIFGRVIIPVVNITEDKNSEMVIAILLNPVSLFQWNFMTRAIFILILVYFLINIFIISKVIGFGEQINKTIVEKFNVLKKGIREISRGNLDYHVHLEGEDEFVELGNHFNQMSHTIKEQIDELREKDRLNHELEIARQVQLGLLPESLPIIEKFTLSAAFRTATEVGGDFYDVIAVDDNRYLFTIGDVSGKGSSAAFYMAQYISIFRYSYKYSLKPEEIATQINAHFYEYIADKQLFITAIIGLLDTAKNSIEFVRAGHTPPIVIPAKKSASIRELKPTGMGLGLINSNSLFISSLKKQKVSLKKNEMLVLYTDGMVEATVKDEQGQSEIYGDKRFHQILENHKGAMADILISGLNFEMEKFHQGKPLADDYTILIIQKTS